MKEILSFLFLPLFSFAQLTYVPDDVFEEFIETTIPNASNGTPNDNYVITSALNTYFLHLNSDSLPGPIFDLTGIEDFKLSVLVVDNLNITSLDLSELNFTTGYHLSIYDNQSLVEIVLPSDTLLVGIDIFNNENLNNILFQENLIFADLHIGSSPNLCEIILKGFANPGFISIGYLENLIQVDFTELTAFNTGISIYDCASLTQINLNNSSLTIESMTLSFDDITTPIVDVSQPSIGEASACWPNDVTYCSNCYIPIGCDSHTSIQEYAQEPRLVRIVDILGRETQPKKNTPLFYLYDDGTVEKRITIE